jgi:hypothetical protein
VAAIGDYLHLQNEPATMRISPDEYPQVERHAGDQEAGVVWYPPPGAASARREVNGIAA